ncbi:UDP-Gal or UDP-GlcNAc-dependent glycosyltransferase [Trypanosoma grayi]|uniref:UDP-Gal or UDP-GlcNAc-dependent glycosyltransferase n=1 Tax=Trypanosoma grayi TaxID=71804 RepID=UPI0004F4591E|nr:UDP-Gal or UDP-GlcNAc-dependent glycosyltransferase [Trypanosoma grayi]KEG05235.1 UDP-Gal or UDP-GlcNAc-dependent glycosyltransferase [Trypanosoma grayi]
MQRLVRLPYTKEREQMFVYLNMTHEDLMIGRVLHEVQFPYLLFVREQSCRFHNLRYGWPIGPVTQSSLVIHDTTDAEFMRLMDLFRADTNPVPKPYNFKEGTLEFEC